MSEKLNVGIIGGAGYTAGELIRLLINHPGVRIAFVQSQSNAGNKIADVHGGLIGECDIVFCNEFDLRDIDILFLCSGHGKSSEFWSGRDCPDGLKIIDLAQDFRDGSCGYVYGLPEVNRNKITAARKVANPGCFATAIQLSLLPLAFAGKLVGDIHVTAITGSTGAGVKPGPTTHFSYRTGNVSVYKAFGHQHLAEIKRTIASLQPLFDADINFIPVRGDFARGIFAMVYTDSDLTEEQAVDLYEKYYKDAAFTHVSTRPIDLKQVVNTNKALVHVEKHGGKLFVTVAIDNLLKGASGQAVQNMNIMTGMDECAGLKLKPSAF